MHEQRMQAYITLIEQLLSCCQGQEGGLLQADPDLLDAGLIATMEQVAAYLENQGSGNAQGLRQLAAQLAEALGLEISTPQGIEAARQFLLATLQLIVDKRFDPQQIYPLWAQQQTRFNPDLLTVLPSVAAQLLQGEKEQRTAIAAVLVEFGNLIQQFSLGIRWLNLELGIAAYEQALTVITQTAMPIEWAETMMKLATTYRNRIRGDQADNIEQAIAANKLVLEVYAREAFPEDWAMTQNNLGNAYFSRVWGNKADNIEWAIASYKLALEVRTREAFPEKWAMTQNNLGNAYREEPHGNRAKNLEQAIAAYKLALEVYTRETFPEQWAMTQNYLGNAYLEVYVQTLSEHLRNAYRENLPSYHFENLEKNPLTTHNSSFEVFTCQALREKPRGDHAKNLEQAIAAYKLALEIYTRKAFPEQWARIQSLLGSAYRSQGSRVENLEQAITTYNLALEVYTREAFPEQWAMTQNYLGNAYREGLHGNRAENLEQAIAAYKLALEVYTRETFPEQWATTQTKLGYAYRKKPHGDRAENLEQAITTYNLALEVFTREAFPPQWAAVQDSLGVTYRNRIKGDRAENLEQAITTCNLALEVFTREAFPENWATNMMNLANLYYSRIRGDRAQNIEDAIAAYEQALQVRTREAMPGDWAQTMINLANAYSNRIRGDHAQNIEDAIAAYEQSLQVTTREVMPGEWATSMMNLANAYSKRIRGDRAQNIEEAIKAYQESLEIFAPELLPDDCRRAARNLGNLYFVEKRWEEAVVTYQTALQAAESLYQSANLLDGKAAELAETADLPRRAAYALARTGDLQKAVETLEQGRARGLSESLDRDRADLTQLQQTHPDLYQDYQQITAQLRNLESQQRDRMTSEDRHSLTPEALRDTATSLRQQLTDVLQDIRKVQGYEDFLGLPTFADVQAAATDHPPLVYLVTTPAGSLALVVTPNTVESLWLDIFNETQLIKLLNKNWVTAYRQFQSNPKGWYDAIDTVTRQLWEPLMAPLIAHLQQHQIQQATLISTGYLSLLPLHAAWTEDPSTPTGRRYALDDIQFTYAPNAKSLTAAQAIAQRTGAASILAIDNPRQDLPNSEREVNAAIASFPKNTVLKHGAATVEGVRSQLSKMAIAHFSCHGTANLADPLNSGLVMSDGLLTLRDIFALNLADQGGLRLAILSACETGLSGIENADEAISLPTGLLQAGVAGVVASLWSVSDLSTMVLLSRFYTLWQNQNMSPATALRCAQQWLRDASPTDIVDHCRTFIPDLDSHKELKRSLKYDYSHPYHWSAFSYTGV
ncbi:MAG: CHAT domain-containing protein [Synechococcales cyanobacterium K44_A2020_017]|nr:CHAT domain-containing protein [Synechococcales cyanobacterium K44_A2020_017]